MADRNYSGIRGREHVILYANDYIIIDALVKKPRTTKELSHLLQLSEVKVAKTLKRFSTMDPPLIVKRSPDRRWVACLYLRVESARDMVEAATGEPVIVPTEAPEPQVVAGKVVYPTVDSQVMAPEPVPERKVPSVGLPPPPPKPYEPPKPKVEVSTRAERLSKQMRVPAYIEELGEVSIGKMGACGCGRGTPMAYGAKTLCPLCARKHG